MIPRRASMLKKNGFWLLVYEMNFSRLKKTTTNYQEKGVPNTDMNNFDDGLTTNGFPFQPSSTIEQ